MAFSSTVFLFVFLPIVYILHLILPGLKAKNFLLILTSLFFYAFGEPVAVIILIFSAFINYALALWLERTKHRRIVIALCAVLNLAVLGFFKYLDFALGLVNSALGSSLPITGVALPIGISFFTFQAMSYVFDVGNGSCKAQKNPFTVLLYLSFFPQLVAGPIVKYHDIELQLLNRTISSEQTANGIRRFILGLSKKLLIANILAKTADLVFSMNADGLSLPLAWLGAISYMMQIYFDFSGYSDMAIGLGHMFGFTFRENFMLPYSADSMKDFWRRWHISVSSWFKEYLYIPLGGNRHGKLKTCRNKLIVFFCTGLWHGANLTFIVWGMIHGLFLLLEDALPSLAKCRFVILRRIYTLLVVCCTFVIFRTDTLSQAQSFLAAMFTGFSQSPAQLSVFMMQLSPLWVATLAVAVFFSVFRTDAFFSKLRAKNKALTECASYAVSLGLLALCILNLSTAGYNPFIYFRF